ncbi:MAG: TRAP transporter small permease [Propionibacteriaceae bacterium]|nr:TRAP transporter small permease [Propionibacteriaceae bacterium]
MERSIKALSSVFGVMATIATLIMMIAIAADVFFRTLYGRTLPGVLELSEAALVAAVFLGLAYTGATNSHIAVDLLTERLPAKVTQWVVLAAWVLTAGITAWLTYATFVRAISSTQSGELRMGLVEWPLWPSRWMITIGFFLFLIVAVMNIIRLARGQEVLGIDEQMPDVVAHPYEYVHQEGGLAPTAEERTAAHALEEDTLDENDTNQILNQEGDAR